MDKYNVYNMLSSLIDLVYIANDTAVVFDIDGTLLDNNMNATILVNLYNKCLNRNINLFLVTARDDIGKTREITKYQLEKNNIKNYKELYMKNPEFTDIILYKKNCRKNIHDNGYNIIFSIGDNYCDIGEYGGLGFLVN